METNSKDIFMNNQVFVWLAACVGGILAIPLIAMQFTSEVDWNLFDFAIMGTLLFGTGSAYILVARQTVKYRIIFAALFLLALLLTWAELAVGLFGTPFAGS